MSVRELSPTLLKKAMEELGEVPSRIPEDLKAVKEWLAKQPHINANLDDQWLLIFLRASKHSLEKTKEKLERFYTAKTLASEIIIPTDPADPKFLELFRLGACVVLKKPIAEDGAVVFLCRSALCGKYLPYQALQQIFMIAEILYLENDNIAVAGAQIIIDMENVTMSQMSLMTPITTKKLILCGEKTAPVRLKGCHQINSPPGVKTAFNLISSFIGNKLKSRFFIHSSIDGLYEHVPRECFPTEYGGDAGPISDLVDYWEDKLVSYRDYFIKSSQYKTDESKRIGKPQTVEDVFGVEGSFRALSVD